MSSEDQAVRSSELLAHGLALEPESQEFIQLLLNEGYSHTVVWYRNNSVHGHGDVYEKGRPKGGILPRYRYDPAGLLGKHPREFGKDLNAQHIYEAVVVAPLTRYSIGTRVVGVKKSMFGLKKRDVLENYEYGDGQYTMEDIIPGKFPQPAAVVAYSATDRYDSSKIPDFKDPMLRRGSDMDFKLALPESLAKRVGRTIVSDPRYIRRLIEAFVKAKYPDDFSRGAWTAYSGPPWDKWDARPGGKMLFVDLLDGKAGSKDQVLDLK